MAKMKLRDDGSVSLRIDGAYIGKNGKYLMEVYTDDDGKEKYFGAFNFLNPDEVKKTLKEAIELSKMEDTIFYGNYPKWKDDEFGQSLGTFGKFKAYKSLENKELIPMASLEDYIYSLELKFVKDKEGGIYMIVVRGIVTGKNSFAPLDELFDELPAMPDEDLPF